MVVWGARVVLEDSFATRIPGLENKPRSLPVNDVLPQVMSYVRSVPGGGSLVWKCVFYCLRIGHVKAALHVLRSAHSSRGQYTTYIQLFERFIEGRDVVRLEFMSSYFNEVEHQRLLLNREMAMIPGCLVGEDAHQLLYDEYCDAAWKAKDPYLSGCLVLLMRLELRMGYGGGNHSGSVKHFVSGHHTPNKNEQFSLTLSEDQLSVLFPTVEDYMWFRLWLCRTPCEEKIMSSLPSSTFVSQEEIQTHIRTCGGAHFDPDGSQPLRYAFVLISAGLFEDAVTYLANHPSDHSTHYAVHLAIVLYHLAWIKDEEAFHQLIMKFVSVFCNIYMTEAALYLMTIRKADVLKEHLKKFIISTGEYETLLGRADANLNQNGLLADLLSSASTNLPSNFSVGDLQSLREKAALHGATEAESKGEFTTAAQLYNLARKTEKSTGMTMRNLAAEVDKSSSSKRQLAVAEARNALRVLEESKSEPVVHNLLASLKELVKISEVFEDYWTGRYGSAWAVLREVDLLPLSPELISICQRKISPTMDKYDPCVLTCLKELIKVALHVAEYALEVGSVRRPEANGDALRTAAVQPPVPEYGEIKSLCIFVGMLGLSDGEVNERLVRIELLLT